jgi:uncharacterized protein (DUF2141 family)
MKLSIESSIMFLAIFSNLVLLPQASASFKGNLTVEIDGLRNQKGQVCLSIFSSNQGFPNNGKRALQAKCIKIAEMPQNVTFQNLTAGSYAIAVIHDVNGDNRLNTNSLGIPTEGFGFSNNPRVLTGPPKFGDSAVFVAGSSTNIQVQLQYLLSS